MDTWDVVQKCGIVNYKVRKVENRQRNIITVKEYNE